MDWGWRLNFNFEITRWKDRPSDLAEEEIERT